MSRQRTRPDESKNKSYITPAGYRQLEEEAFHLWNVERPKVSAAVAIAAAEGDRSENAEYIYGKKKMREIDARLQYLGKRLEALTIVDAKPLNDGRVFFGAWVTVEDEDGELRQLHIVGPDEVGLDARRISVEAPMAKALLGKRVGDEVTVPRPKGDALLVIEAVSYDGPHVAEIRSQ
jgi:transcription elongation factor GreB